MPKSVRQEADETRQGITILKGIRNDLYHVWELTEAQERTVTIETGMPHMNPEGDKLKKQITWIDFMVGYFELTLPNDFLLDTIGDEAYREYCKEHPVNPDTRVVQCPPGPLGSTWTYLTPIPDMALFPADREKALQGLVDMVSHHEREAPFEKVALRQFEGDTTGIELAWAPEINTVFVRMSHLYGV